MKESLLNEIVEDNYYEHIFQIEYSKRKIFVIGDGIMTDEQKEIKAIYEKYAKKGLEESKNMTVGEERKYIEENEPKMKEELKKVLEKYKK